jgi:hypothetical protein
MLYQKGNSVREQYKSLLMKNERRIIHSITMSSKEAKREEIGKETHDVEDIKQDGSLLLDEYFDF